MSVGIQGVVATRPEEIEAVIAATTEAGAVNKAAIVPTKVEKLNLLSNNNKLSELSKLSVA